MDTVSEKCRLRQHIADSDSFAVANVDDEVVLQLGPRLRKMNELLGVNA